MHKAKKGDSIIIIKKMSTVSRDYDISDILIVDGFWYGGVWAINKHGIDVSLNEDEYQLN